MTTKTLRCAALAATAVLLGLGLTGPAVGAKPPPAQTTRVQSLGAAAAVIDFCSRIDRDNSAKYSEAARKLMPGVSDSELAKAKASADYQNAYKAVERALGQLSSEEALAQCMATL